MKRIGIAIVLALSASFVSQANASLLAFWNMNDTTQVALATDLFQIDPLGTSATPLTYASDSGSMSARLSTWGGGIADGNLIGTNGGPAANSFGSFTGTTSGDLGFGSGGSLSITGTSNSTKYFTLAFDSAKPQIDLSYWTRGTGTGFTTHTIRYSTDGGANINLFTSYASNQTSTYMEKIVNFGNLFGSSSGLNQNIIYVEVSGSSSASGNNRFDNINLSPEPTSLALVSIGILALARRRR